jgi:hypothetical protein
MSPVRPAWLTRRRGAVIAAVAVIAIVVAAGGYAFVASQSGAAPLTPSFVDETNSAGIAQTYAGGATFDTGGGVAVFDCNGDGKPEIYMAGGTNPAVLYRNDSAIGGALRFSAIHDPATDLTGVTGAYPIDIDGDGNPDLAVLRAGGNVVLRGLGGCRFETANETWGIDGGKGLSIAFSATWEGANRLPTLAFGRFRTLGTNGSVSLDCDSPVLIRPDESGCPVRTGHSPGARVLPALDAVQRLERHWREGPAGGERPQLLHRRAGAALADGARPGA